MPSFDFHCFPSTSSASEKSHLGKTGNSVSLMILSFDWWQVTWSDVPPPAAVEGNSDPSEVELN